ncbi:uncharacterized protein [Palaemon carinicauda]|uniref:uncharacterized protein n=1 Tax=Palaemon carinicauda TaxID=392227 RepID=UPI0035B61E85
MKKSKKTIKKIKKPGAPANKGAPKRKTEEEASPADPKEEEPENPQPSESPKPPPEENSTEENRLPEVVFSAWAKANFIGKFNYGYDARYFNGLQYLMDHSSVTIGPPTSGTYIVKDMAGNIMYYANTPVENDTPCCGYGGTYLTGTNFSVTTSSYRQVMSIKKKERKYCFFPEYSEWKIKVTKRGILGLMEVCHTDNNYYLLKWKPGKNLCSLKMTLANSLFGDRHYKILPASVRHGVGSIVYNRGNGILLNFPSGFNIPGRALVLSGAIILQYEIEGEHLHKGIGGYYVAPAVIVPESFEAPAGAPAGGRPPGGGPGGATALGVGAGGTTVMKVLQRQGIDESYVGTIEDIYTRSTAILKLHKDSRKLLIVKGLRQGDSVSSKLFTACLEYFKNLDRENVGININGKYLNNSGFADDIVLFCETWE